MTRLIKIELEYLDILKDFLLTFSLYRICGGYKALIEFPENFSILVFFCFLASIVTPVFLATIHLVMNNPYMIFYPLPSKYLESKINRIMMTFTCCIFSLFNPIFLVNAYESAKEKIRRMAVDIDVSLIHQMRTLKDIKSQWKTFVKIELGKYKKKYFPF